MPTTNGHEVQTGCVLSAPFGWHNHARMIATAVDLGYEITAEDQELVDRYDQGEDVTADYAHDFIADMMDEAERWLNDHTPTECLVCGGAMEWRDGLYRAVHVDTGKMYCATTGAPMGKPQSYLWHWSDGEFFLSPFCGGDDDTCDDEMCAHWSYQ